MVLMGEHHEGSHSPKQTEKQKGKFVESVKSLWMLQSAIGKIFNGLKPKKCGVGMEKATVDQHQMLMA